MSIIIDDQPLEQTTDQFQNVGDVLEHVRRRDHGRMIVRVLLDGVAPSLADLNQQTLGERTLYVETADRKQLVADALGEAAQILDSSEEFRQQAIDALSAGDSETAMQPLNQWLSTWRQTQKAIVESAQAIGINLETLNIQQLVADLANQLRQIKTALESHDYVTLSDILNYEAPASMDQWRQALSAVAERV
ncbi:MAG TPA: hypothetical protein VG722_13835 [Tepidisphaeraceae bacterium]|nr:hypothetical protein [Tepidisphaeraceae bacterium]